MAEELQSLLDRIQRDGVQKAAAEQARMLEATRIATANLVRQAEQRADELRRQAEGEAKLTEQRANAAIRQGARDILLALREELQQRLRKVVRTCVGEAMTPELMGQLILAMQRAYLERPGNRAATLEVMLNAKDQERLSALCHGALGKDLQAQPRLTLGQNLGAGLKLGQQGEDLYLDFTDEAITDLVCAYIGPRLAAILTESTPS